MTEIWKPNLNQHGFLRFYSLVFSIFNDQFEKLNQTLERVLIRYPITSKSVKKNLITAHFSSHFMLFGNPGETLFFVFDILHETLFLVFDVLLEGDDRAEQSRQLIWSGHFCKCCRSNFTLV